MRTLWYIAYLVASLTWLALMYIEWQVPGFSGTILPSYLLLILAIVCGIGALLSSLTPITTEPRHTRWPLVGTIVFGVLLGVTVIRDGDVFGPYRVILAIAACLTPPILVYSLRTEPHDPL